MQSYLIVTFIKFTDLLRSLVQCNPRNIEILTVLLVGLRWPHLAWHFSLHQITTAGQLQFVLQVFLVSVLLFQCGKSITVIAAPVLIMFLFLLSNYRKIMHTCSHPFVLCETLSFPSTRQEF